MSHYCRSRTKDSPPQANAKLAPALDPLSVIAPGGREVSGEAGKKYSGKGGGQKEWKEGQEWWSFNQRNPEPHVGPCRLI